MTKKNNLTNLKVIRTGMWWLGVFVLLTLGFTALIGFEYQRMPGQIVDAVGRNMALSFRQDWLTPTIVSVTHFGYYGTLLIWLLIIGILAAKREHAMLTVSMFLSAGGWGLGAGIKLLAARLRPVGMALVNETSHSFPSLHALTAIVLYMFIAYLAYYYTRRFFWSYLVFLSGFILALAIGLSRVYLGVHYFTDVLAGFSLGIGWFLLVLFVEKVFCITNKKYDEST